MPDSTKPGSHQSLHQTRRETHFTTRAQARRRVPAWIEEYNHDRRHFVLGVRSPVAHELALQATAHEREQAA